MVFWNLPPVYWFYKDKRECKEGGNEHDQIFYLQKQDSFWHLPDPTGIADCGNDWSSSPAELDH